MSASGQMSHMARNTRSAPRTSSRKSCTSATRGGALDPFRASIAVQSRKGVRRRVPIAPVPALGCHVPGCPTPGRGALSMSVASTSYDRAPASVAGEPGGGNGDGRMHVLVLTDRDWTHPQGGGTGTNLFGQVSRWLAWGHRVTLIACGYPGGAPFEQLGDLTIHRVGGRSTVFPHAIVRQSRGLVPDADVVLEVVNGITFLTPLWLRTPRLTLVHHIHRDHYVREMGTAGRVAAFLLETLPLRLLYRRSRFLTISHASARDIARHGIPREHIAVGYIGVELDSFARDPSRRAERPTLLYLGRLKRYKRIELVL